MTLSQNAALYSSTAQFPTGPKWRLADSPLCSIVALAWLSLAALALPGCKDHVVDQQANAPQSEASKVSKPLVPLRVWFAADHSSQELIERQWQATSERPLALSVQSSENMLAADKCESDVIIFPSHLLGELIARGWLVELPAAFQSRPTSPPRAFDTARIDAPTIGEAESSVQPAARIDQTRYGRSLWGISLGVTTPVILSNFDLPRDLTEQSPGSQDSIAFWHSLIKALSAEAKPDGDQSIVTPEAAADEDAVAVCDRYMIVLTSICERESRFGILLDPETLKSRLAGAEFVEAAKILLQLHQANSSPRALLGSFETAWEALAETRPAATIGLPPTASVEVDKVTSIRAILPPLSMSRPGARNTRGWNSGHGLVVALTSECRQTSQAIEFMRWLASDDTRGVLGKRVAGTTAESTYAPSSSAWQSQRLSRLLAQQPRLPSEPRLPGSLRYRTALGVQLARMLRGEQSPEESMKAAAEAWDQITATAEHQKLRTSYEQSLGL